VVRGVGPLLELTTAAAVRLPREALFSFSTAAILHASVNEMPLSAFIRWTFYSSIHLGQSLGTMQSRAVWAFHVIAA